ncbi:MAG: hypothetical protein ACD_39C00889G0002 [uncultured bacterium]|nr:MAG: hypothetical protein ACD_39C00889G0002 [uncultured bacterium]
MLGSDLQPFLLQTNFFLNLEKSLGVALELVKRDRLANSICGLLILSLSAEKGSPFSSCERSHKLFLGFFVNLADFDRVIESSQLFFGLAKKALPDELLNLCAHFFKAGRQVCCTDNTRLCTGCANGCHIRICGIAVNG